MSSVAISGNASGAGVITIASPNTASNYTMTLPAATDTFVGKATTDTLTNKTLTSPTMTGAVVSSMASSVITSSTAVASTSGTSIDFTALPSWIKRITIMFQGVSLSSTANVLVQLGTGSTTFTTTGYLSTSNGAQGGGNSINTSTAGFVIIDTSAAAVISGHMVITNITGNNWVSSHVAKRDTALIMSGAGDVSLGAVLTAVRITSTSTDTFDAGSINIFYE
jgi:hypothetical protein